MEGAGMSMSNQLYFVAGGHSDIQLQFMSADSHLKHEGNEKVTDIVHSSHIFVSPIHL